jgi:Protein of unknown function (DUF1049).
MRLLRRLVTLAWVLALLVTGCALYLFNPTEVALDLVWVQLPAVSIAVLVLGALFIGLVTGSVLTALTSIWPSNARKSD